MKDDTYNSNKNSKKVINKKPKVLVILGPTGVGKSSLSIDLAMKFNGDIISADSVQIFKEFDIGSAKISPQEMMGVKHYGIDIISPNQEFSVFDYVEYTKKSINEIVNKNKLPIIVGGTGLYIKALINNYNFGEANKNEEFRQNLEKEISEKGLEFAYQKLKNLDEDLALKTDRYNKVRVIRALEIKLFGTNQSNSESDFDFKIFALTKNREVLYRNINARVDEMIQKGLIREVQTLLAKYGDCQPMKAIGYKETADYLNGKISKEEMVNLIKQHSRNYAKRQLTYLRGMKEEVVYVDCDDRNNALGEITKEIEQWLKM